MYNLNKLHIKREDLIHPGIVGIMTSARITDDDPEGYVSTHKIQCAIQYLERSLGSQYIGNRRITLRGGNDYM